MTEGWGLRSVEIHQAFVWTCDDCGQDNFERAVRIEPASIDPAQLPDGMDVDDLRDIESAEIGGSLLMAPDRVCCRHCRAEFASTEN